MTEAERERERCAQIADRAAQSAARWLPNESARAKVSIANAIACSIRSSKEDSKHG